MSTIHYWAFHRFLICGNAKFKNMDIFGNITHEACPNHWACFFKGCGHVLVCSDIEGWFLHWCRGLWPLWRRRGQCPWHCRGLVPLASWPWGIGASLCYWGFSCRCWGLLFHRCPKLHSTALVGAFPIPVVLQRGCRAAFSKSSVGPR